MIRRRAHLVTVLMMVVGGCAEEGSERADGGRADRSESYQQTFESGPVTVQVGVDKQEAAVADPIRLTLTVTATEDVEVELPKVAELFSDWELRDTSAMTPAVLADGRRQWSQTYTLESYVAGVNRIPAMVVKYAERGETEPAATSQPATQPTGSGQVVTEAIEIRIASSLQDETDPTAFRDIKPLAAVHLQRNLAWGWWGLGIAATIVVVFLILRRRRKKRAVEEARIIIPPHEWAMRQLDLLAGEDLVGKGMVHEYYFRLSGITREYIERRFQVSAPDMTTEEFLLQVGDARYLDEGQKQALAKFLEACDLVKFAKYQPSPREIEHAFDAAKSFVMQTAAFQEDAGGEARAEAAA